jgi:hypothetical protein
MRLRLGASKGHYVRAPDEETIIDRGDATITDRRVVFQGPKQLREWDMAQLVGFSHDEHQSMTAIQVSNRQKVSGLVYKGMDNTAVHLALDVAAAVAEGRESDVVAELRSMLPPPPTDTVSPASPTGSEPVPNATANVTPSEPTADLPAAPTLASVSPRWAPDPSGRHEFRYWDGRTWTPTVADNGVTSIDRLANNHDE